MITLGAFLTFVVAASLPVTYLILMSRWIESEERLASGETPAGKTTAEKGATLVEHHA